MEQFLPYMAFPGWLPPSQPYDSTSHLLRGWRTWRWAPLTVEPAMWPTPSALEIIWFIHMLLMTGIQQRRLRRIWGSCLRIRLSTETFCESIVIDAPVFRAQREILLQGKAHSELSPTSAFCYCFCGHLGYLWLGPPLPSSFRASSEFPLENSLRFFVGNNCDLKRPLLIS